jgi:hypothetical protein
MIWYDTTTLEPVAPGACEDGGPPSIIARWCPECKTERFLKYEEQCGICEVCRHPLLVTGLTPKKYGARL